MLTWKRSVFVLGIVLLLAALASIGTLGGTLGGTAQAQTSTGAGLIWQAPGTPNRPGAPGALLWTAPDVEPVLLADVPETMTGTRVLACGSGALSPDGSALVAFIGAEVGGLYRVPLDGGTALTRWGDVQALACNGPGRAAFSPDGTRWAYLQYQAGETSGPYADANLRVLDAGDGSQVVSFENAIAFKLLDNGLYFVQFFADSRGLADEAVVTWWDGAQQREILDLEPAEGCNWRSAALDVHAQSGRVLLSLGEQCPGASQWRLFSVNADDEVTQQAYLQTGGGYLPWAFINQVIFLPDGKSALAVYPNGRAGNVGNLMLVEMDTNTVTLVTPEVTVNSFPDGNAGHLLISPAGDALAYVSTTANGAETLHRLPLDGSLAPLDIEAGGNQDAISTFFFRPNGDLLYVAGGADGADNSLFLLPAGGSDPERVVRGRFLRNAGVAGANLALVAEYVAPDDDHRSPAQDLIAVDLRTKARSVAIEGRAADTFAYPLTWHAE